MQKTKGYTGSTEMIGVKATRRGLDYPISSAVTGPLPDRVRCPALPLVGSQAPTLNKTVSSVVGLFSYLIYTVHTLSSVEPIDIPP